MGKKPAKGSLDRTRLQIILCKYETQQCEPCNVIKPFSLLGLPPQNVSQYNEKMLARIVLCLTLP